MISHNGKLNSFIELTNIAANTLVLIIYLIHYITNLGSTKQVEHGGTHSVIHEETTRCYVLLIEYSSNMSSL